MTPHIITIFPQGYHSLRSHGLETMMEDYNKMKKRPMAEADRSILESA